MARILALAERIAGGAGNHTMCEFNLAVAVINLEKALASCRANDRTALYGPGEARRDGARPADDVRWMTPREIVEQLWADPAATRAAASEAVPSDVAQAALAVERAVTAQPGEPVHDDAR